MTLISNDPTWWPLINWYVVYSYFIVASSVAVVYDWALTLGQEIELVWRRPCSLMTVLYLSVRYIGMPYSAYVCKRRVARKSPISFCDRFSAIIFQAQGWMTFIILIMLGVIMITRLHAMFQQSRKMFIFLIAIFVVTMITYGVLNGKISSSIPGGSEVLILSGTHHCVVWAGGDVPLLNSLLWILTTAWEVIALCLAVWIVTKHFRDLPGPTLGDCFMVLTKTHVFYFAAFAAASCFNLGLLSPNIMNSNSVGDAVYYGIVQIAVFVQQFVLGPRLILSVRESHAKLVANSDEGTRMSSIAFQEHVQSVSADGGV